MKKELITIVCVVGINCFSQNIGMVNGLEEVVFQADKKLEKHSTGHKITILQQIEKV